MNEAKIPAVSFTITSTESVVDDGTTYTDWAGINRALDAIARQRPAGGGYAKTRITIEWADGTTHAARVDVDHDFSGTLGEHVARYCRFYAGDEPPAHLTRDDWQTHLAIAEKSSPGTRDYCVDRLARYAFDDVEPPEPVALVEAIAEADAEILANTERPAEPVAEGVMLCDGCGAAFDDDEHHTDAEICGNTDDPGFYLCAGDGCARLVTRPADERRERYARQRAANDARPRVPGPVDEAAARWNGGDRAGGLALALASSDADLAGFLIDIGVGGDERFVGELLRVAHELLPPALSPTPRRRTVPLAMRVAGTPAPARGGMAHAVGVAVVDFVGAPVRDRADGADCGPDCPGWAVFDTGGGVEIQRCDECDRFASDDDAAAQPGALHALALAMIESRTFHATAQIRDTRDGSLAPVGARGVTLDDARSAAYANALGHCRAENAREPDERFVAVHPGEADELRVYAAHGLDDLFVWGGPAPDGITLEPDEVLVVGAGASRVLICLAPAGGFVD